MAAEDPVVLMKTQSYGFEYWYRSVQRASFTHWVLSQHKPDSTLNSLGHTFASVVSEGWKVWQGCGFIIGAGFKFGTTDFRISRLSVFFLQCVLTVADHQFDSSPKLDFLVSARHHIVQDGRHRTHNLTAHQQLLLSVQSLLVCLSSLTTSADVSACPVTSTVLCRDTRESMGRCFIQMLPFCWISYYTRAQHSGRELLTNEQRHEASFPSNLQVALQ